MKTITLILICAVFAGCVSVPVESEKNKPVNSARLKPRRSLKKNMSLIYVSNGKVAPAWIVKSVGRKYRKNKSCAKTKISYDSGKTFETREECIQGNILREKTAKGWKASRPVASFMSLEKKNNKGASVRELYNTSDFENYVLGDKQFVVLNTQVVNYDKKGKIVGRLSEKYSVDLGTAVEGIFEIPSKKDKGWIPINKFKLVKIR